MSSSPSAEIHQKQNNDKVSSPVSSSPTASTQSINNPTTASAADGQKHAELANNIAEHFPPFDHHANIVTPFNDETNRDLVFERELSSMLLDALIETHAWASARPKHESTLAAQNIEQKIVAVMEAEKEQDRTRERLNDFVVRMKNALTALMETGFGV